ncbi:DEAD/DEAH box helicase [Shewanella submarina]|uniref:DEAD/DEAH box helicase n=1 Tax=Shewanella submarina TaxID=2016376 RepID=A0ABV7GCP1_9GAMM|nr:DEAD/DEAH box helicase [Shewanella submarina]MCL1036580.1 DEAD/DEAH box helicase [Shewanella submarina]
MNNKIIKSIIDSDSFKQHYKALLTKNIKSQFSHTSVEIDKHSFDVRYLLRCADMISMSDDQEILDKALRICQHTISSNEYNSKFKEKAEYILKKNGNYPLIELARKKKTITSQSSTNKRSIGEVLLTKRMENVFSISLINEESFKANKFQLSFWEKAEDNEVLSVSAPTAAGKSFIFCLYILNMLLEGSVENILYLVPTRALVTQVSEDLEITLKNKGLDVSIITLPNKDFIDDSRQKIFVLTQERLHFLLNDNNYSFDFIFIDEAHKLSDSYRGILLQHAIMRASSNKTRVIYASPFSKNPEKLLSLHKNQAKSSVYTPVATVNQNLFWVSQVPKVPKNWYIEHISDENIKVGVINLTSTPNTQIKRLSFVAYSLGKSYSGNLVYVNIPSDAEKACGIIVDQMKEDGLKPKSSPHLNDLIELCEKTIHKDFLLIEYLKYGVAFHYGNIPQIIRNKIESLFKSGEIAFLACTSTLVEGVNLSCRNIFVRGPKKGRSANKPMTSEDFWNLAGRAGRWGQEFQGNIFCLDVNNETLWPNGKPEKRIPYIITPSVDKQLNNSDNLINYIKNGTPRNESINNIDFEYLISYVIEGLTSNNESILNSLGHSPTSSEIILEINNILEDCELPSEIFQKNAGISPIAVEELYRYFKNKAKNNDLESLIPPHPSSENAVIDLTKVLSRINKYLSPNSFGFKPQATFVLSLLIIKWMNGHTVARIISDREKYNKSKGQAYKISTLIRNVLDDIENIARFRAPKYLACYNDVLLYVLKTQNQSHLADHLRDVQLSLEFGVNIKTQLSLISLGLSRTSAIEISEFMSNSDLNKVEVLNWLLANNLSKKDMPNLVRIELEEVLSRYQIP